MKNWFKIFFSFCCSKAKKFILIACIKDLFLPKIIIFLLNMLWEICCHIFRETKNWEFKKFCSPIDEIYKETPGSGQGTHISQHFVNKTNIIFFEKQSISIVCMSILISMKYSQKMRCMCSTPTSRNFFVNFTSRTMKLLEFSIFGFSKYMATYF
jgi:hypothetical protein